MPKPRTVLRAGARAQRGVFLIEALLGILIFSLGILSLVAMQTAAVSAQSDARYRIEAADFADQILSEIWLTVARPGTANNAANAAASLASITPFAHQATGAPNTCNFSGAASASQLVTNWVGALTAPGTGLPGATAAMQQISIVSLANGVPPVPAYSQVSVTVCWKTPIDATPHRHTVVAMIGY